MGLNQMLAFHRLLERVLVAGGARKLMGPPEGPIERQLIKYFDNRWNGGSWEDDKDKTNDKKGGKGKRIGGKMSEKLDGNVSQRQLSSRPSPSSSGTYGNG